MSSIWHPLLKFISIFNRDEILKIKFQSSTIDAVFLLLITILNIYFRFESVLVNHLKIMGENSNRSKFHAGEQEFNQSSLEIHYTTNHENVVKKHKCEICKKSFKTKPILKRHFSTVHDNNGKIINCNICSKSFSPELYLKKHT